MGFMNKQTLKNIIRFLYETKYDHEKDRNKHIKIVQNILNNENNK